MSIHRIIISLLLFFLVQLSAFAGDGRHIEANFKEELQSTEMPKEKNLLYLISCADQLNFKRKNGTFGKTQKGEVFFSDASQKNGIYLYYKTKVYFLSLDKAKRNRNYGLSIYLDNKKFSFELITHRNRYVFAESKYVMKFPAYRHLGISQELYTKPLKKVKDTHHVYSAVNTAIVKSVNSNLERMENDDAVNKKGEKRIHVSEVSPISYCRRVTKDIGLPKLESFVSATLKEYFPHFSDRMPASVKRLERDFNNSPQGKGSSSK